MWPLGRANGPWDSAKGVLKVWRLLVLLGDQWPVAFQEQHSNYKLLCALEMYGLQPF